MGQAIARGTYDQRRDAAIAGITVKELLAKRKRSESAKRAALTRKAKNAS